MYTTETHRYPRLPRTEPWPTRPLPVLDAEAILCLFAMQTITDAVSEIDAEHAADEWRLPHNACPQCKQPADVLVECPVEMTQVCPRCAEVNRRFDEHCLRMSRAD